MVDPAFAATAAPASDRPPEPVSGGLAYDGETMFRGIFFGTGPVAKLLPEIWERPEVIGYSRDISGSPMAIEVQQGIMDRLREQDPAFFARFGADLQSGDHLRIQAAVESAAELILKDRTVRGAAAPPSPNLKGLWVWIAAVDAVAAVTLAVIVFFFVLAPTGSNDNQSSLQKDVWTDLFANRLASSSGGRNR